MLPKFTGHSHPTWVYITVVIILTIIRTCSTATYNWRWMCDYYVIIISVLIVILYLYIEKNKGSWVISFYVYGNRLEKRWIHKYQRQNTLINPDWSHPTVDFLLSFLLWTTYPSNHLVPIYDIFTFDCWKVYIFWVVGKLSIIKQCVTNC